MPLKLFASCSFLLAVFVISGCVQNLSDDESRLTAFDIQLTSQLRSEGKCGFCGTLGSAHIHADFKVYLDEQAVNFNNAKYFVKSSYVHVEPGQNPLETGNVLHVHAQNVPLWLFFKSVGMSFDSECFRTEIQQFCNSQGKKLRFFVNGVENNQFGNYVPQNLDKILITYGKGDEVNNQLNSITEFADRN